MNHKTSLVITSISAPNAALAAYAEGCLGNDIDFILVGDVKSPKEFELSGCDYWSIERQKQLRFKLAGDLPVGHYSRKNLGYLVAMSRGAEVVIETDDDNLPYPEFWSPRLPHQESSSLDNAGWVNMYRYFTDRLVWPRGFPLEQIHAPFPSLGQLPEVARFCPIQQGLADDNPDVDAVFRLIDPAPVRFLKEPRVTVGPATWTPFNSQNTSWFKAAFPLLYIPSHCSFRMCDIWRSFVALRICHANGWGIHFHGPTVWQDRNHHNLMHDFADEIPGYINNSAICSILSGLDIKAGESHIGDNLVACYRALTENGFVKNEEMRLLDAWLLDIDAMPHG